MNSESLVNQVNLLNSLLHALQNEKATLQAESQRLHAQLNLLGLEHDRVADESTTLRQKNQDLQNTISILNDQLKKNQEIQKVLAVKQKELMFFKTQNKKCQAIITKNRETITQLTLKNYDLEKALQIKTLEFTQRIEDLECNKLPQLLLQNQLRDAKIVELSFDLSNRQAEMGQLNSKLTKQIRVFEEEKLSLTQRVGQLDLKYSESVKSNQKLQKSILTLQNQNREYKSQLQKERALSLNLQNKLEVDNIILNKLENEMKQQQHTHDENIAKLNTLLGEQCCLLERQENEYKDLLAQYQSLQKQKVGGQSKLANRLQEKNQLIRKLTVQSSELRIKIESLLSEKKQLQNLITQHRNQIQELKVQIDILQKKNVESKHQINRGKDLKLSLQNKIEEIKSQSNRKESLLKQKVLGVEKEISRLQDHIHSIKVSSLVEGQGRTQKDMQISALKKIISEQERYISDQKTATQRLTEMLTQKSKQIDSLETNNSMLRKQVLNALANQDSTRQEMLMKKQQLRKTNGSNSSPQRRASHVLRKRLTVITQANEANSWQDCDIRRSDSNLFFASQKNVNGSLKSKLTIPSQENQFTQI